MDMSPGAEEGFKQVLQGFSAGVQGDVMTKISQGHAATQTKLDNLMKAFREANAAASDTKSAAVESDKVLFLCYDDHLDHKDALDLAEKSLATSQGNEQQACQLKENNKDFAFSSSEEFAFKCDHGVEGECDQQLATLINNLNEMEGDAEQKLSTAQEKYNGLSEDCQRKQKETVNAQTALNDAQKAWSEHHAHCTTLPPGRAAAVCSYGSAMQNKCKLQNEFKALVEATNKANGDMDSEVDRIVEFASAFSAMCMAAKNEQKGLDGPLSSTVMEACAAEAKAAYSEKVGNMNRYEGEFNLLSASNACAAGPVTFFNGQEWQVPNTENPKPEDYVRADFKPSLDLSEGSPPFASCAQEGGGKEKA